VILTEKFTGAQAMWRADGGRSFIFGDDQEEAFAAYAAVSERKLDEVMSGTHRPASDDFLRPAPSPRHVEVPVSYRPVEPETPKKRGWLGRLFAATTE
jgi:hypothetical protein